MSLAGTQTATPRIWHAVSTLSHGPKIVYVTSATSSGAWPTADLVIYVPIIVRERCVAKKLFASEGATGTGYWDLAIYDYAGVKLIATNSVAKGTAVDEVVVDVTDTTLSPGVYYMGMGASNATDTFHRVTQTAPVCAAAGILTQALSSPTWTPAGTAVLPATATWAVNQTLAYLPACGFLTETTVA